MINLDIKLLSRNIYNEIQDFYSGEVLHKCWWTITAQNVYEMKRQTYLSLVLNFREIK